VPLWQAVYSIGLNDSATDIRECANGDFIITGHTDTLFDGKSHDIFLLRIDAIGNALWSKVYGTPDAMEFAWSVLETTRGDGNGTAAGDFVVAGARYTSSGGITLPTAYLLRTDANGTIRWDRLYTNGENTATSFHAAEESTVGAGAGDIIAGGFANDTILANTNAFMVRVNGGNGGFGGPTRGALLWGGGNGRSIMSIEELTVGAEAGNIVAVGLHARSNLYNIDWFVLKTGANPALGPVAQRVYLGNTTSTEAGNWIREIRGAGTGFNQGDLVITGTSYLVGAGPLSQAFQMYLEPAALAPATGVIGVTRYGNDSTTCGYSIAEVGGSATRTPGFIMCGTIGNPGNYERLYLVKNSPSQTTCTNRIVKTINQVPDEPWRRVTPNLLPLNVAFTVPSYGGLFVDPHKALCYDPAFKHMLDGGATGSTIESIAGAIQMLRSYPNPVAAGSDITLEYHLAGKSVVALTVTDVAGTIVHTASAEYAAGDIAIPVKTDGWRPGVYVVKVASGNDMLMAKVVVTE